MCLTVLRRLSVGTAVVLGTAVMSGCGSSPSTVEALFGDVSRRFSSLIELTDSAGTYTWAGRLSLTLEPDAFDRLVGSYWFEGTVSDGLDSVPKLGRGGVAGRITAGAEPVIALWLELGSQEGDVQLMSLEGTYHATDGLLRITDGYFWVFYPPCDIRCAQTFRFSAPVLLREST